VSCVSIDRPICSCRVITVAENKVSFGVITEGKQMVLHKQFEFVKHREYANGTTQWQCKLFFKKSMPGECND